MLSFVIRRRRSGTCPSPNGRRKTDRRKCDTGRNHFQEQIHHGGPTPTERLVVRRMSDRHDATDVKPRNVRSSGSHPIQSDEMQPHRRKGDERGKRRGCAGRNGRGSDNDASSSLSIAPTCDVSHRHGKSRALDASLRRPTRAVSLRIRACLALLRSARRCVVRPPALRPFQAVQIFTRPGLIEGSNFGRSNGRRAVSQTQSRVEKIVDASTNLAL